MTRFRRGEDRTVHGVAAATDITARKRAEEELAVERRLLDAFLESTNDQVYFKDLDGRFLRVSNALAERSGFQSPAQAIGKTDFDVFSAEHARQALRDETRIIRTGRPMLDYEERETFPDGHVAWVSTSKMPLRDTTGAIVGTFGVSRDISVRKEAQERLVYLAERDPLTGLHNRRHLEAELHHQLERCARYGERAALLMLDLDHFKFVNDSLGHSVGDEVITHVGTLLRERLRASDVVARLGGDEFAAIVPCVDVEAARCLAQTLTKLISNSAFEHAEHRYLLSASAGVVMLDGVASTEDALIGADVALYEAKRQGRNRVDVYCPTIRERVLTGLSWSQRLQEALAGGGFELHEQAIVDLRTDEPVIHELLIRMRGEHGALIPPNDFLVPAARFGYMPAIDRWVISQAARLGATRPGRCLAVNLAAQTIGEPGLVDYIAEQLSAAGAEAADFVFELSESDVIANLDRARALCEGLRALGARVALDDFGSGFSGFSYLKALDVHVLKIDGQFVRELGSNAVDKLVVEAIVHVANGLKLPTVAEYVTDAAVARRCRELGVTHGQGFHFGKPAPICPDDAGARARASKSASELTPSVRRDVRVPN